MALTTNTKPYFDTFSEENKFYQVLFRPTTPIQARELNELQSILQNQITRLGNHMFKEGAMVIPGQATVDNSVSYVKIESTTNGIQVLSILDNLVSKKAVLVGADSGIKAMVIHYEPSTDTEDVTIYVKYQTSASDNVSITFSASENILAYDDLGTLLGTLTVRPTAATPFGKGTLANVQRGVYFVWGRFVLCDAQTIVVSKYTSTPDAKIGLSVHEYFDTPELNSTLLDNAQGTSNYAAPGAHRHYMDLKLTSKSIDYVVDSTFVELITLKGGIVQAIVDTTAYSVINDTLARRTYDESGSYTVSNFSIEVKEHRNNNQGAWAANKQLQFGDVTTNGSLNFVAQNSGLTGSTIPSHTIGVANDGGVVELSETAPQYNNGVYTTGDVSKLALAIGAGKAYVYGYEIGKSGTTYVDIPKARTYSSINSGTIPMFMGSLVAIDNVYGPLDTTVYPQVQIRDAYVSSNGTAPGNLIGTARARFMQWLDGTVGSSACQYVVSLFDISMTTGTFENNARSIFFNNATGADFTANLVKTLSALTGTISTSTSSTAVTGVGTKFTQELSAGNSIAFYNGATLVSAVIASIASDTSLTLSANAGVTLSGVSFNSLVSGIAGSSFDSMIQVIPHAYAKSLRSNSDGVSTNTEYYVKEKFTFTASASTQQISTSGNDVFASIQNSETFMVIDDSTGYIAATFSSSQPNTVTIGGLTSGHSYTVFANIKRVMKERSKTLVRAYSETISSGNAAIPKIVLSKTDGYKLRKIMTVVGGVETTDITNQFTFDGGQKDSFYDYSTIKRIPGAPIPTTSIKVYYDYFAHGSVGDFFSPDSYVSTNLDVVEYVLSNGQRINLLDCVDFRPDASDFGSVRSQCPVLGYDMTSDYSFYLPRIDRVYLGADGNFGVAQGVPSETPNSPALPEHCMEIYTLFVAPRAMSGGKLVSVTSVDNRRYTMRDIGNIDRRLQNVEYYTALNLLEQQVNNLQLYDANGNLNMKSGFIVDPFSGQNIGDTKSFEYRCSVDPAEQLMSASVNDNNVQLSEIASTQLERQNSNYANNNGMITLQFTEEEYVKQPYASKMESVAPFMRLQYIGNVDLTPGSDDWYETSYLPNIVVNQEGNYDALMTDPNNNKTVWNSSSTTTQWYTPVRGQSGLQWAGVSASRNTALTQQSTSKSFARQGYTQTSVDPLSVPRANNKFGGIILAQGSFINNSNTALKEVQTTSKSGTQTYVQAVYDTKVVDDRIISVDLVPYIRPRPVLFTATGLRPMSKMYAFFDGVDVSEYITPVTVAQVDQNTVSGTFTATQPAETSNDHAVYRKFKTSNRKNVALSFGDIVHNGTGGNIALATKWGVLVHHRKNHKHYHIVMTSNTGEFSVGETIHGSLSGASATLSTVTASTPLSMITDVNGSLSGIFDIPCNDKLKFTTGSKKFKLSDSSVNNDDVATATAEAVYSAVGYLQTKQDTVVSTRNGVVKTESVSSNTTTTTFFTRNLNNDPLAQSFYVQESTGVFLNSIDLFFGGKDPSASVWFYLAEMRTGLPTTNVIPGSRVILSPDEVSISSDSSVATTINFPYPIYLNGETEYALVVGSTSPKYFLWVSQVGEYDKISGKLIADQPSLGSLFKSQNASTWAPEQMEDIKFVMRRCKFNSGSAANVAFKNVENKSTTLIKDPMYARTGSPLVRVYMPNHGLEVGSKFQLSGATSTGFWTSGINATQTVLYVEHDSVVFQMGSNSTGDGYFGGSSVVTTTNFKMDRAQLLTSRLTFPATSIAHFLTGTDNNYVKQGTAINLPENDIIDLPITYVVASKINEDQFLGGLNSVTVTCQLESSTDYLSPVLDTFRYSLVASHNRIDSPTSGLNIAVLDDNTLGTETLSLSGSNITGSSSTVLQKVKVGRYITISGSTHTENNSTFLVTADGTDLVTISGTFTTESSVSLTISQKERYVDEISSTSGVATAKYIMKSMSLDLPADQLKVYYDVNLPTGATIDLYYRVLTTSDSSQIEAKTWTKLDPDQAISQVDSADGYFGAKYTLQLAEMFDHAQIKLVMRSTNTAKVPKVKNLRMIAMV